MREIVKLTVWCSSYANCLAKLNVSVSNGERMSHKIVGLVSKVSVNELVKNEILYLRGAHDIGIIM